MESPMLQEIYLEGRQEGIQLGEHDGIQQGERIALRSAVAEILASRFDLNYEAGQMLEEKLNATEDVSLLRRLLVDAITTTSIEEFMTQLQG
jgi:predicted transposase YdaD